MDYEQLITVVAQGAGVGWEAAERATRATLSTLAERLSAGEARDIAQQLPPQLAPWIGTVGGPDRFGVDEFLRRVAEREGVDVAETERHARAVFTALGQAVSADELEDMASELPKDFTPLLPRSEEVGEIVCAKAFVHSVAARRAGPGRRPTCHRRGPGDPGRAHLRRRGRGSDRPAARRAAQAAGARQRGEPRRGAADVAGGLRAAPGGA